MSDFISNGLSWFQSMREVHCTDVISIGLTEETAVQINATASSDDGQSTQNRVNLQKQIFHFVVRRRDIVQYNIKLQRGLKIWYKDDTYELSPEAKDMYEYNDPDRNDLVLKAILVADNEGIHP